MSAPESGTYKVLIDSLVCIPPSNFFCNENKKLEHFSSVKPYPILLNAVAFWFSGQKMFVALVNQEILCSQYRHFQLKYGRFGA